MEQCLVDRHFQLEREANELCSPKLFPPEGSAIAPWHSKMLPTRWLTGEMTFAHTTRPWWMALPESCTTSGRKQGMPVRRHSPRVGTDHVVFRWNSSLFQKPVCEDGTSSVSVQIGLLLFRLRKGQTLTFWRIRRSRSRARLRPHARGGR